MGYCKYKLPCGKCERYDRDCDAPKYNDSKECEHDWEPMDFEFNKDALSFHCVCRKCNTTEILPMDYFLNKVNNVADITNEIFRT